MEPRLSYVIGRLDRLLRRRIGEVLAPHGLTVSQYTALSVMRAGAGLSNAQLARRVQITPQSMNEVVAQLAGQKLIQRRPDPAHGRAIRTDVTPRGERVLDACDNDVDALEQDLLAGLHVAEIEQMHELLVGCVRRLGAGL
jgi:DNA-binding MarR family transcriptional regulator